MAAEQEAHTRMPLNVGAALVTHELARPAIGWGLVLEEGTSPQYYDADATVRMPENIT